nr:hypothetical protein [Tanacetum cinerariifolium]
MRTRSSSNFPVVSFNPSTSKRCNRRRSQQPFILEESPVDTMADQRTMAEFLRAPTEGYAEAIVVPPILAEQFELKCSLINMMTSDQLFRLKKDNPHDHIRWFNKITSTIKYKDVPNSAIKLMLFPFSLARAARRYKELLHACPHHGFTELHQFDTFYNALNPVDQDSLNAAAGGNLLERQTQDVLTIIENKSKARNSRSKLVVSQVKSCDVNSNSSSEIAKLTHAVNQQTSAVTTAMTAILKQFQATPPLASVKAVEETCVTCGAAANYNQGNLGYRPPGMANQIRPPGFAHPNVQNNQNRFGPPQGFNRGNNYNPQSNFNPEQQYQAPAQQNQNVYLNEMEKVRRMNEANMKAMQTQIDMVKNKLRNEMKNSIQASLSNQTNEIKNMMASLLQMNIASTSGSRSLPSNTVDNPKGELKSITTRGGLVIDGPTMILRDGDEGLILNMRHDTSSYSNQPQRESINLINFFNNSSEDFLEDLFSNQPSGNPTFSSHPELTSPKVNDDIFDSDGSNVLSEKLLDLDSTKDLHPPLHDDPLSGRNKGKAVKASACWIWRPRQNSTNKGPNSNSGNSQNVIDDKGYWDSGYSQHMTGNICYISDYEPYDGAYVSFRQRGGKIIGKDKHQLKFNIHKDAKSLMEAIEKRLQKIISQLEILGESLSQKDINLKFLRSLPSEWRTHTLIWRNKVVLVYQSLDELFNNLKIYEVEVKSSSSTSHNTQNIAFVSSQNTDSTNESASAVPSVSAVSTKVPIFALPNVDNLSDAVIYSFFASQSNSPQLDNDDLKQIDADDLKEMDLKWQMAMLTMRSRSYDWGFQADEEPTNYALMAFTSSISSSSDNELDNDDLKQIDADDLKEMDLKWQMAMLTMRSRRFLQRTGRNLRANGTTSIGFDMSKVEYYNCHRRGHFARECRSHRDTRNKDTQRRNVPMKTFTSNALVSQCDCVGSYDWGFQADEEPINYALMAFTSSISSSSDNENENVFKEDIKLLKLDVMLRDNALVELRKKFKNVEKERDNSVFDYDELNSSKSDVSVPTSLVHDRYKSGEGYHAVPPPYTGTFMPPKPDLVFHDAPTASKTVSTILNVEPSTSKPTKDLTSIKPVEHPTQAEHLRQDNHKSRIHKHSWNRKACFVCKSVNHLIKDCDYYEKKMVQKLIQVSHVLGSQKTLSFLFDVQGNPQQALKDKGVIDSGCSRHMNGNISYLSDFEEINGGYVAFGRNPKGGKLTGKGNKPNHNAGVQGNFNAYGNAAFDDKETESEAHVSPSSSDKPKKHNEKAKREAKGKIHVDLSTGVRNLSDEFEEFFVNSTNRVNAASAPVTAIGPNSTNNTNSFNAADMPALEDIICLDDEEDVGAEADFSNLETRNKPNHNAGVQGNFNAYGNAAFDDKETESEAHVSPSKKHNEKAKREAKGKIHVDLSTGVRNLSDEFEEFFVNSTNRVNAASAPVTAIGPNSTNNTNSFNAADMPALEDIICLDDEEDVGAEADFSNLETTPQTRSMTMMVKQQGRLTQMFACFPSQEEPKKVHQALEDLSWIEAMQEELL